jgi:hypothetical protein
VARHVGDLVLGAPPLGDVLVGGEPAAAGERPPPASGLLTIENTRPSLPPTTSANIRPLAMVSCSRPM